MANQKKTILFFKSVLLLLFLFTSFQVRTQCSAGINNTVTVCNKDQDPTTRNFNLFANLGGTPTGGGTWSTNDPANYYALNPNTGDVDLWRINNYGIHQFIYTNDACGESAVVTINLGGYPGENNVDGSANACSDNHFVNLHSFLGSETDGKVQDVNGLWEEDPSTVTGFLEDNIFDAYKAGPGLYTFSYTVSAVGSCTSRQSSVVLEVHPSPNPGTAFNLAVCTNEDLSAYTNIDLNDYLAGEESNGTWSERSGTNQLSNLADHEIDVQAINTNFGYGTYTFRYTVYPSHPICGEVFSEVNIIILPALDGVLTPPNFCAGTPYDIPLAYDSSILPNGEYRLQYQINSSNGTQTGFENTFLSAGRGTLQVSNSLVVPNEYVLIDIVAIDGINPDRDVCANVIVPEASFLVSNATATAADICPSTDVTIELSNVLNTSGNLSNDTYNMGYTITDPDGSTSNFTVQNIDFANGSANFNIPSTNLTVVGEYSVAIDIPNSFDLDCIGTTFSLIPAPEEIELDLIVDNNCDATQIDVIVDAPILINGGYTVTYEVTELDSSDVLVSNTISFNGGTANYLIDITTLSQGNYTVVLKSTQNDTTPCRTIFDFDLQENFAIGGIPETPLAEANQVFCATDFGTNSPTLADLIVTASGDISFFATETDTNILPINTMLVDGEDYFVTSTDPDNNCESSDPVGITVIFATSGTPTTTNTNPIFCASENATIASLEVLAPNNGTIVWYDLSTGGNLLDSSEILIDGKSYFASEQINGTCESDTLLEMVPTVYGLEPASLQFTDLAICGLDNPTVEDLRNLENPNGYQVLWYDTAENGTPLSDDIPLVGNATYFAESFNPDTGCINPERIAVTVDLTNCDPDDYGFFIPDGFSPNGDGRNDTFYIPNIEIIFPDFTLEILNRYGVSLFKGGKNNSAWDGDKAPSGVYFYIIDYNKEGFVPKQGRLYLNR